MVPALFPPTLILFGETLKLLEPSTLLKLMYSLVIIASTVFSPI